MKQIVVYVLLEFTVRPDRIIGIESGNEVKDVVTNEEYAKMWKASSPILRSYKEFQVTVQGE
jgi:hypothetical protein